MTPPAAPIIAAYLTIGFTLGCSFCKYMAGHSPAHRQGGFEPFLLIPLAIMTTLWPIALAGLALYFLWKRAIARPFESFIRWLDTPFHRPHNPIPRWIACARDALNLTPPPA